jgi:aldehyde dehydrogenase (NAD+)
MSTSITTGVLSAVADRRTKDLRYRQRQLLSLHRWISKNLTELESAIRADDGLSSTETQFVIALALDELRRSYDSLDLKKELDIEFRIKNGQDNTERMLPEDIVYVIPDNFTLFYSVMSALCTAIAAGSCCVIEVCASHTPTQSIFILGSIMNPK